MVRDKNVHEEVIKNVIDCAVSLGYKIKGLTYSSIKGPSGNIEYLIWISTNGESVSMDIEKTVNSAHEMLI